MQQRCDDVKGKRVGCLSRRVAKSVVGEKAILSFSLGGSQFQFPTISQTTQEEDDFFMTCDIKTQRRRYGNHHHNTQYIIPFYGAG
jgi:hypothetical protein